MKETASRRRAGTRAAVIFSVMVLVTPLLPAHAAVGVRTTRAIEFGGSAAEGVMAWTQAPRSNPTSVRALARIDGSSPIRLNPRGTRGFTAGGAVAENGNRIAYWQHRGGKGNIKLFNVSARTRRSVGLVNTPGHEWGASLSGRWLLFARGRYGGTMRLFVANLRTGNIRRLARVGSNGYLQPGDVSGRWVTWTTCAGFRNCSIVRYNLRTGNRKVLGNPQDRSQFASSVLNNGTVFYGESGNNATCATRLRIYKAPLGSRRSRITTLPAGTSIAMTSVKRVSSTSVDVFYDQAYCDTGASDIYRNRVRG